MMMLRIILNNLAIIKKLFVCHYVKCKGSGGLMDKVSASQPQDRGFEPRMGDDHDSSYDTSTDWFQ